VFVVTDGKASRREVETAPGSGDRVQILSGLRAGEVVISRGGNAVRDGGELRIVNGPGATAAPAAGGESKGAAK
jgi:multidrug efflux pump subunit AcrA (membrane-fusion protein)